MADVRLGFIGAGPRSRGLMQTTMGVPGVQVAAVADPYADLRRQAVEIDQTIAQYETHKQLIQADDIDAVFVVVEPENCPDIVVDALRAGKHVLSEVPMALSLPEIWRIVLAAEQSNASYMLAEQLRYVPHVDQWCRWHQEGRLGKLIYAEGEYIHGMNDDRFFLHPETGARLTVEEASQIPNPVKSRMWKLVHPILYLPHEMSPLLRVLDDRVVSVVGMATRADKGYVRDFLPMSDMEVALMKTAGDVIMRLACSFTVHHIHRQKMGRHWHRIIGTRGSVETNRSDADKMKVLWVGDNGNETPTEVWHDYDPETVPREALESGHGGTDFWPIYALGRHLRGEEELAFDVYAAAETAAPAAAAAWSIEQDGVPVAVPDFRPGPQRAAGQPPAQDDFSR